MNSLTFTAGSFYRTRDGRKAVVYAVYTTKIHGAIWDPRSDIPWSGCWGPGGHNPGEESDMDLISPWTDPIEFDVSVVPPWFDLIRYCESYNKWSAINSNGGQALLIPSTFAPKNADKTKAYRVDRKEGKLVPI